MFLRNNTSELFNEPLKQPVAQPLDTGEGIDVGDDACAQVVPVLLPPAETGPQTAQLKPQHGVIAINPDVVVAGILENLLGHEDGLLVHVEQTGFEDELHNFGAEPTRRRQIELSAVEVVPDA